ncbi:hypothetical protein LTR72_000853 [Exophiala xenobiotica]|nr:hypothetical protein LTR72_000853 [Exophiala xenobiotica]KAK5288326.1 hypothetical protein LTR14_008184 [Exophiala xenobiotica]KAK5314194.1 hypothetical protein LTR93_010473 [Exophiala xenobiotica]KAK5411376.1 hypothetical protein LTR06_006269 [Exophiala xenobiotica]KAK5476602.1 hypothetical protein LTR55_008655 [Exophiala xenobiotica]
MPALARVLLLLACYIVSISSAPLKRDPYNLLQTLPNGDLLFELGNLSYVANIQHPKAITSASFATVPKHSNFPVTVFNTNASVITGDVLQSIVASYLEADDVFTEDFLESVIISSTADEPTLDATAFSYLKSYEVSHTFVSGNFKPVVGSGNYSVTALSLDGALPSGPYMATTTDDSVMIGMVYLLYADSYRNFLFGAYDSNDGNGSFTALPTFLPRYWNPMIPVPSRIHSWGDDRPLAGERVAIKDLFDIKGLQTSGGSQAWAYITPIANGTAPSIQRIIDLGGVIVGKYKLAQFASGANPWEWQDEHYPFNPRGDGWLTCSASSSGGGCSIAAYDWLDYSIGTDTGSSMRRPAAVAGVYGQRPSQGLMNLQRVMPLGGATDTTGVFSRDPYKWVKFSKAWYTPSYFQTTDLTGLSPLSVPDTDAFPKRILYPVDYLPLNNSAAEVVLQDFIANMSSLFGMTLEKFNFSATVQNASDPQVNNLTYLSSGPLGVINRYTQWEEVAKPLIETWANLYDGRFPPIDPARRPGWRSYNESLNSAAAYETALHRKNLAVEWYEQNLQFSTPESCSESVMLYDIGSGGLPSFREESLNDSPAASYLAITPPGAKITGANICPIYGCADFTIPIGQVPYFSNVTFHEEMVPVTINMVVKRGCDFVLLNMIEKMADAGILKTVKTGRTAF